MGRVLETITDELAEFLASVPVFFVATAPLAADGHVNVSPKGGEPLRVLDPHRVAYLDATGSGAETAAHLRENGRITIMACAFSGPPRIVRLHGRGRILRPGEDDFERLRPRFGTLPAVRSIVDVAVARVSTSCGYGVPLMEHVGERSHMDRFWDGKGPDEVRAYQAEKNAVSIDGLPAFEV